MRLRDQLRARFGIRFLRLRHHDHALGAGLRIGRTECRDAALADTGNRRDGFLDLVRIGVPPGADDDVLDAAGDVHVAARDVGAVAALDPAVVEQLARLCLVAEVTSGHRGPAKLQHALVALAQLTPRVVDDAHVVLLDRMTAGDHLDRVVILRSGRLGVAALGERLALNAVDLRPATERRETQADAILREAIARRRHAAAHPVVGEAAGELAQGLRGDRFRAVDD